MKWIYHFGFSSFAEKVPSVLVEGWNFAGTENSGVRCPTLATQIVIHMQLLSVGIFGTC